MNLLLDTHIVLWWLSDDPVLSETIRGHIGDTANMVFVSAATVWEVAIKASIGKLEVDDFMAGCASCGWNPAAPGPLEPRRARAKVANNTSRPIRPAAHHTGN